MWWSWENDRKWHAMVFLCFDGSPKISWLIIIFPTGRAIHMVFSMGRQRRSRDVSWARQRNALVDLLWLRENAASPKWYYPIQWDTAWLIRGIAIAGQLMIPIRQLALHNITHMEIESWSAKSWTDQEASMIRTRTSTYLYHLLHPNAQMNHPHENGSLEGQAYSIPHMADSRFSAPSSCTSPIFGRVM